MRRSLRTLLTLLLAGLALVGGRDLLLERIIAPRLELGLLSSRLEAAYIPTVIKSLQYGTITISAGTSATATITSVDTTKCGLMQLGFTPTGGVLDKAMGTKLVLTNATTVTATLINSGTTTTKFVVVCFQPGLIKSIQRGSLTSNSTATITAVNTAKTILISNGETINTGNTNMGEWTTITLTNATTISSTSATSNGSLSWEAWEFY